MTTPYERLLQEAIPVRPEPYEPSTRWTAAQQLQHQIDLLAGIDGWVWDEERRDEERRHLRLIEQTEHSDTDAA